MPLKVPKFEISGFRQGAPSKPLIEPPRFNIPKFGGSQSTISQRRPPQGSSPMQEIQMPQLPLNLFSSTQPSCPDTIPLFKGGPVIWRADCASEQGKGELQPTICELSYAHEGALSGLLHEVIEDNHSQGTSIQANNDNKEEDSFLLFDELPFLLKNEEDMPTVDKVSNHQQMEVKDEGKLQHEHETELEVAKHEHIFSLEDEVVDMPRGVSQLMYNITIEPTFQREELHTSPNSHHDCCDMGALPSTERSMEEIDEDQFWDELEFFCSSIHIQSSSPQLEECCEQQQGIHASLDESSIPTLASQQDIKAVERDSEINVFCSNLELSRGCLL